MSDLQRYGLEWKSEKDFVCQPMADGYWTPWHIATEELTHIRSEVERLRGRLCNTCEGSGMIGGPSPSAPDEGGEPCPECVAFILRKQAEAVEEAVEYASSQIDQMGYQSIDSEMALKAVLESPKSLRQQADEAEKAGGGE